MEKQLIYKDLAKYYDLLYSFKDYKEEANQLKKLIKKHKRSKGNKLLEIACGTGKHVRYLKDDFSIIATDLNTEMLVIARKNVKGVTFKKADMVNLRLGKKFDVILCLFSSIGYVKSYANLRKTINGFSQHLNKGGVVIIEPWLVKKAYEVGRASMTTYDGESIKIARLEVSKAKGVIAIMDMNYLVAERNKDVKYFIDRHELGMFDIEKMKEIMEKAGLKARYIKNLWKGNRGLVIGVKSN